MRSDDELKDWEMRDEEPPEWLKGKWSREEDSGPIMRVCSSCKKEVPGENLACIFCGALLKRGSNNSVFSWLKKFMNGRRGS